MYGFYLDLGSKYLPGFEDNAPSRVGAQYGNVMTTGFPTTSRAHTVRNVEKPAIFQSHTLPKKDDSSVQLLNGNMVLQGYMLP